MGAPVREQTNGSTGGRTRAALARGAVRNEMDSQWCAGQQRHEARELRQREGAWQHGRASVRDSVCVCGRWAARRKRWVRGSRPPRDARTPPRHDHAAWAPPPFSGPPAPALPFQKLQRNNSLCLVLVCTSTTFQPGCRGPAIGDGGSARAIQPSSHLSRWAALGRYAARDRCPPALAPGPGQAIQPSASAACAAVSPELWSKLPPYAHALPYRYGYRAIGALTPASTGRWPRGAAETRTPMGCRWLTSQNSVQLQMIPVAVWAAREEKPFVQPPAAARTCDSDRKAV